MSITYEEALETLQSMFGEPWTRDTLDSVLRHEKGHMENTVDLILRHGNQDPETLVNQLEAGVDPRRSSDAVDEALARQLSRQGFGSNAPSSSRTGKGKPTTLPEDFLRVPGGVNSISDDEALARMLQDELFTEELSRNPDFAHLARGRSNYGTRAPSSSGPAAVNPVGAAANRLGEFASRFTGQQQQRTGSNRNLNNNNNVPQSPNIMDKISELGDNAKRRLQLLAAQFNANANNNNSNRAAAGGTANSPGAGEFRGLLDDDDNDNMELAARKDL
jgi:CUE domain